MNNSLCIRINVTYERTYNFIDSFFFIFRVCIWFNVLLLFLTLCGYRVLICGYITFVYGQQHRGGGVVDGVLILSRWKFWFKYIRHEIQSLKDMNFKGERYWSFRLKKKKRRSDFLFCSRSGDHICGKNGTRARLLCWLCGLN